uniref:Uncharacterized protein n=1 Tax=Caenorhabditis japonica TaxID=281687 RepID=A0A8R1E4U6_CAEJA
MNVGKRSSRTEQEKSEESRKGHTRIQDLHSLPQIFNKRHKNNFSDRDGKGDLTVYSKLFRSNRGPPVIASPIGMEVPPPFRSSQKKFALPFAHSRMEKKLEMTK